MKTGVIIHLNHKPMEVITQPRETSTLSSLQEVPTEYSRERALRLVQQSSEIRNTALQASPSREAVNMLYRMYEKIGAIQELPGETQMKVSYLSDFWRTLYLKNNLCPGDIPFSIVIEAFTDAVVYGLERKVITRPLSCGALTGGLLNPLYGSNSYAFGISAIPRTNPFRLQSEASLRLMVVLKD